MKETKANQFNNSLKDAEILVVAPRFPSINQPWMDTYFEQLLEQKLSFGIATSLDEVGEYQAKVDRLGLRQREIHVESGPTAAIKAVIFATIKNPILLVKRAIGIWSAYPLEQGCKKRLSFLIKSLHVEICIGEMRNLRIVHSHSLAAGQYYVPKVEYKKIPLVVTFHGLEPPGVPQVPRIRRELQFHAAARVVVNTRFACQQAIEVGCPEGKIEILPQGLPIDDFPFLERSVPGPEESLKILSVGRFHRDKGQAESLLAMRRLADGGFRIRWHFVGVGPDKARLERLAEKLRLSERVLFHQGLSAADLLDLYHQCHLFVLASRASRGRLEHVETQGVVLQEAQACGCIPIATRVGGIPECINDNIDGLLIPDRSHRAIFDAIVKMMEQPQRWHDFQTAGRRNVETRFSAKIVGKKMAEILRDISGL